MQKCLGIYSLILDNNEKFFDFPFTQIEDSDIKFIENPSHKILFLCDFSKFEWYRIIVTPYIWTNQEAIMVNFAVTLVKICFNPRCNY